MCCEYRKVQFLKPNCTHIVWLVCGRVRKCVRERGKYCLHHHHHHHHHLLLNDRMRWLWRWTRTRKITWRCWCLVLERDGVRQAFITNIYRVDTDFKYRYPMFFLSYLFTYYRQWLTST